MIDIGLKFNDILELVIRDGQWRCLLSNKNMLINPRFFTDFKL